jgi:hypothetical protein
MSETRSYTLRELREIELENLRALCPEQMGRDPTGKLATLTKRAAYACREVKPTVTYVHGGACGGVVALAGRTAEGELFTSRNTLYDPTAPREDRSLPAGEFFLLHEPLGFPSPPQVFDARCARCSKTTQVLRADVVNDVRQTRNPRRIRIHPDRFG